LRIAGVNDPFPAKLTSTEERHFGRTTGFLSFPKQLMKGEKEATNISSRVS
jgi:hypothetical protein